MRTFTSLQDRLPLTDSTRPSSCLSPGPAELFFFFFYSTPSPKRHPDKSEPTCQSCRCCCSNCSLGWLSFRRLPVPPSCKHTYKHTHIGTRTHFHMTHKVQDSCVKMPMGSAVFAPEPRFCQTFGTFFTDKTFFQTSIFTTFMSCCVLVVN